MSAPTPYPESFSPPDPPLYSRQPYSPQQSPAQFPPQQSPAQSPPQQSPAQSPLQQSTPQTEDFPTEPYLPPLPPDLPPKGGLATGALIGLIVGIVMGVLIVLAAGAFCVIWRRKKIRRRGDNNESDGLLQRVTGVASNPLMKSSTSDSKKPSPHPDYASLHPSQSSFSYEKLSMASDQFSDANFLGEGGFGFVHKGVLPNGKEAAIKHLKSESVQGERLFKAEVEIISRVHHKHLVSVVGYCVAGAQRMPVYEFIPNFSLYFHLHACRFWAC